MYFCIFSIATGVQSAKLPDFYHGSTLDILAYMQRPKNIFLIGLYVVNHNHLHHKMLACCCIRKEKKRSNLTLAWQCVTSERAGAFSLPPPNWSTAVLWQPACRMRDTLWRPYCVTHHSPMTCQGLSLGMGEVKGDHHWRQGSVEEALCSAP